MQGKELYKAICLQAANLPVFLQYWWMDAVCAKWSVAIAIKGKSITGVWPYPVESRLGVAMMRNPAMTPYLGPCIFYPPDIKEVNKDSFEHEVVEALLRQMPDPEVWHLSIQPNMKQAGLFRYFGLNAQVQQTFLLDLQQDEATLFANCKEPLRRNIRAAEADMLIVDDPQYLRQLHDFQRVTLEEKGVLQAQSYDEMRRLFDTCKAHDAAALWTAVKDGQVQAVIWHVWDQERSYYLMGAKNAATDSYRAMSLLLWHAIKEAKKKGHRFFDFEGSMDPGVERFFRNFGGTRALYLVLRKNKSIIWRMIQLLRKR